MDNTVSLSDILDETEAPVVPETTTTSMSEILSEAPVEAPTDGGTVSLSEITGGEPAPDAPPLAVPPEYSISMADIQQSEIPNRPLVPQGPEDNFVDLYKIFEKDYGNKGITKEQIITDDRLMEVVYSSLEARYKGGLVNEALRVPGALAGADTGGLSGRDYRNMDKEKVFEIYQNYQRSFAGAQTVTTANEIVYGMNTDDKTQAKLGAGYALFDQMGNIFTGEGSWAEMADGIWDYTKAGVWDPSTLVSFGIGKALSAPATRLASASARLLMTKSYQAMLKKGMTDTLAKKALGLAAKSAAVAAPDAVIQMGADVAYQLQLIDSGAQKEYSGAQTGLASAGALVGPLLLVGTGAMKELRKGALKDTWAGYQEIDQIALALGGDAAKVAADARVSTKSLFNTVDDSFGLIKGDRRDFLGWNEAKAKAGKYIATKKEQLKDQEVVNAFNQYFWLGAADGSTKGYYQALKEAGFVVHGSMLRKYIAKEGATVAVPGVKTIGKVTSVVDDIAQITYKGADGKELTTAFDATTLSVIKPANKNDFEVINTISGVFGQAIKFLPDAKVKKIINAFEADTGRKLGITKTAKGLSNHFIKGSSLAGETLWLPSQLSRLEKAGKVSTADAIRALGGAEKQVDPKLFQYTLSTYKRLLTSHLATTGANIKGFTQLVGINTLADTFTAAVNISQSGVYKLLGNVEKAGVYSNRAYGSLLGAARRGISIFSPELESEYAKMIFNLRPDVAEKLFRDIGGDAGSRNALERFNLDPKNKVLGGVEATTKGLQTITGTRLQDELTKTWAFGNSLNQAIMREYGVPPEVFYKRADAAMEMATDRFQNNVLDKAVYRTLRETASLSWSTLPAQGGMRSAAKTIETWTSKTPLGFIVPFGTFLNTTIATMGDLTGVNALRMGVRRATGKELDFATQEGAEAIGKMAAGWTIIAMGIYGTHGGKDRVKEGLAYNMDKQDDGSIQDAKFDWPMSTMRLLSQIAAHGMGQSNDPMDFKLSEVPQELLKELAMQTGGQAIRDMDDLGKTIISSATALSDGDAGPFLDMLTAVPARIVQGATRPLDPINQVVGLLTDANMNPDLRQGPKNYNTMLKYVNNIFPKTSGVNELPSRLSATSSRSGQPDFGKQLLGTRAVTDPTNIQSMLNAAGRPDWSAIRFDGPAVIKNTMDGITTSILETTSKRYMKNNPDYYSMSQKDKEKILDKLIAEVKTTVTEVMKQGVPRSLEMVRVLASKDKNKVKEIMDFLQIEGSLEDVLDQDDSYDVLKNISMYLDNYDQIFSSGIKFR